MSVRKISEADRILLSGGDPYNTANTVEIEVLHFETDLSKHKIRSIPKYDDEYWATQWGWKGDKHE